ncbi:vegetative cell wall protein gp1-like [Iris pallida]|uniref:Vegetative cell wall protein gp1-like n=1 Tax=Iris pallida TaxID=29817 RepID=A0AAX6HCN9_IRIPA|nr:vegetative cell wall protein gp1-like [Iris pallida]
MEVRRGGVTVGSIRRQRKRRRCRGTSLPVDAYALLFGTPDLGRHDNCGAGLGSPERSRWLCPLLVRDRSSRRPRSRAVVRARARRRSERRARSWRHGCMRWPGRTAVATPDRSLDRGKGFDFSLHLYRVRRFGHILSWFSVFVS